MRLTSASFNGAGPLSHLGCCLQILNSLIICYRNNGSYVVAIWIQKLVASVPAMQKKILFYQCGNQCTPRGHPCLANKLFHMILP